MTFRLIALSLPLVMVLAGCQLPGFEGAAQDVNDEFTVARQLRDRCDATADVDDCVAWLQFKETRSMPSWEYDRALDRWIANGPY